MNQWDEIKQEIEKHSHELLVEFMKLFPCERKNFFLPIPKKIFKSSSTIIVKGRQVGTTNWHSWQNIYPWVFELSNNKKKYVICADAEDFWYRWNRFKKLRLFL